MVQRSAGISEAAIEELSKAIKEFAKEVQHLVRTIEDKPECDYMQYLRKTKVGQVRSRRK